MNTLKDLVLSAGVCAIIACFLPAGVQASILIDLEVVDEQPDVPSLWICEWIPLPTDGGETLSWVVHADEDIPDLEFRTWDNTDYLVPGWDIGTFPFFDEGGFECSYEVPDGPPGEDPQPYWQRLHLWGPPPLPECTYVQISISHVPELFDVPQNLWVHATPEPATLCLLALGSLAVAKRRR